jgi:hypothetical protein
MTSREIADVSSAATPARSIGGRLYVAVRDGDAVGVERADEQVPATAKRGSVRGRYQTR